MILGPQFQAIADYTGQSVGLIAFFFGLSVVLIFYIGMSWTITKLRKGIPPTERMDLVILCLGMAIVTYLEWWPAFILLGIIFIAIFAIVFLRDGSFLRGY